MSFPTHNCPDAIQVLFRRLGVRQITRSTVIWTVFTTMLLAMTACNTAPTPTPNPTAEIVTIRMTAVLIGELIVSDGCLRVKADNGTIVRLGGGGGESIEHLDERLRPELPLPANCPGPYWIVGSVVSPQ